MNKTKSKALVQVEKSFEELPAASRNIETFRELAKARGVKPHVIAEYERIASMFKQMTKSRSRRKSGAGGGGPSF
jgi:hypothetical protein